MTRRGTIAAGRCLAALASRARGTRPAGRTAAAPRAAAAPDPSRGRRHRAPEQSPRLDRAPQRSGGAAGHARSPGGHYPTLTAYLTGVEAHEGGRISAGGVSNPAIYDRAAGGIALNQLITDFGRTSNLASSARLRGEAEDQRSMATAARRAPGRRPVVL